jgi:hypothetical protein
MCARETHAATAAATTTEGIAAILLLLIAALAPPPRSPPCSVGAMCMLRSCAAKMDRHAAGSAAVEFEREL